MIKKFLSCAQGLFSHDTGISLKYMRFWLLSRLYICTLTALPRVRLVSRSHTLLLAQSMRVWLRETSVRRAWKQVYVRELVYPCRRARVIVKEGWYRGHSQVSRDVGSTAPCFKLWPETSPRLMHKNREF